MKMNRRQILGLVSIVNANLVDSSFEMLPPDSGGKFLIKVTSPSVPSAERVYEIGPLGGFKVLSDRSVSMLEPEVNDDPEV